MNQKQPSIKKGIYQHYKGKKYEVVDLARHTETEEWLVVYKALYKTDSIVEHLWVRPLTMFVEEVSVEGKSVPRFQYLGKD
ncbi:MAG: DUF1653 domain-containing protein [Candidatus Omnitrophica bacterium]|nr:DUF1653 domain-containing protein [Candidatus Omnitrophota bacterium]